MRNILLKLLSPLAPASLKSKTSSNSNEEIPIQTTPKLEPHVIDINSAEDKQEPSEDDFETDIDPDVPPMPIPRPRLPPSKLLDMNSYTFPTKCHVPKCTRRSTFSIKERLYNHMCRTHFKAPYNLFALIPYPQLCPEQNCHSLDEFSSQSALVEHFESQHEMLSNPNRRGPGQKRKSAPGDADYEEEQAFQARLNTYTEFPTKCKEAGCVSETNFKSRVRIAGHLRKVHSSTKTLKDPSVLDTCTFPTKCPIPNCPTMSRKTYTTKALLRRHLLIVHNEKKKKLGVPSTHAWDIPSENYPTLCPHEDCRKAESKKTFQNNVTLKRHYEECHAYYVRNGVRTEPSPSEQCEQCGQVCKPGRLGEHMKLHTNLMLVCEDCGSQFTRWASLREHRKMHHALVPPNFPCTICTKTFRSKLRLQHHTDRHNSVKKAFCQLCPKSFLFKWELNDHSQYVHAEELGLKKIECTVCGKHFLKNTILKRHMDKHTGKAKFNCELCGYRTSMPRGFREHMATVHSEEFGFECEHCGKKFKLQRRLRSHLLTHKDSYDHECQDCKKRFACERTLKLHRMRMHKDQDSRPTGAEDSDIDMESEDDGEEPSSSSASN